MTYRKSLKIKLIKSSGGALYQDIFLFFYLLWFQFLTNCSHIQFLPVFFLILKRKRFIIFTLIYPLSSSFHSHGSKEEGNSLV